MCGRYRRTTAEEELARRYRIPIPPQRDLPISWNIAPSQDVLAIRYNPKPFPADQMRIWEISPRVNSPNSPENNDPGIIDPIPDNLGDWKLAGP